MSITQFAAGGTATKPATIQLTISGNTNNYNIFTSAGSPDKTDQRVEVTINNAVIVGSTSVLTPAMTRGTGWAARSKVIVRCGGTSGRVVGHGGGTSAANNDGRGGESTTKIDARSGGGGGGGGTNVGIGGDSGGTRPNGANGTATAGGAGDPGDDLNPGTTRTGDDGEAGGPAMEAPTSGEDIDLIPGTARTLELWGGGGQGGGGRGPGGNFGGNGGKPTVAGGAGGGNTPTAGGAAGANKSGAGTINNLTPGTVDEDGPP